MPVNRESILKLHDYHFKFKPTKHTSRELNQFGASCKNCRYRVNLKCGVKSKVIKLYNICIYWVPENEFS